MSETMKQIRIERDLYRAIVELIAESDASTTLQEHQSNARIAKSVVEGKSK